MLQNFSNHNVHTCAYYPNNMGSEYLTLRIISAETSYTPDEFKLEGSKDHADSIKKECTSIRKRENMTTSKLWMYLEAISNITSFELDTTIGDSREFRMIFKKE
jgi:hypothetical protein